MNLQFGSEIVEMVALICLGAVSLFAVFSILITLIYIYGVSQLEGIANRLGRISRRLRR